MNFPLSRAAVYSGLLAGVSAVLLGTSVTAPAQQGSSRQGVRPAYLQWTTYLNPRFAYQVPVPPGLRARTDPTKGSSCRFSSDDGIFTLKAWGRAWSPQTGDPLAAALKEALAQKGRRVEFQRRSDLAFILAGSNADGTDFFEKTLLGNGITAGVNVTYPTPLAVRFTSWVDEIERGFSWHRGSSGPVLRNTEAPRGRIFDDLRRYFTGEEPDRPYRRSGPLPEEMEPEPEPEPEPQVPDRSDNTPEIRRDPSRTKIDLTPPPAKPREDPAVVPLEKPVPAPSKPAPAKREDLPFGVIIPGKKGFVYSPFADKQQVDVTDIPTGTKVKCPYTGKVFRVP